MMDSMVKCLRALGDENRLRILMLLRERELCVLEVVGALGISQPLASSHLAVLREAGLATAHREGRRIRYSISEEAKRGGKHLLLKQVAEAILDEPLIAADRDRIEECAAFREKRRLRQRNPRQFPHEKELSMNRTARTILMTHSAVAGCDPARRGRRRRRSSG